MRQHVPGGIEQRRGWSRLRLASPRQGMGDGVRDFAGFGLWTVDCGLKTQPRLQVLLKTFLRLKVVGDDDNGTLREKKLEQNRKKRLRRLADPGASQHSAMLQSQCKALHRGSFQDVSEQVACRRRCRGLRQAKGHSQRKAGSSSRERLRNHGLFVSEFELETGWLESFQPLATTSVILSMGLMGMALVNGLTNSVALVMCCMRK